jgi:hypothetical protein
MTNDVSDTEMLNSFSKLTRTGISLFYVCCIVFVCVSDPRTADWLLMSSPFPTLAICLIYVFAVKVVGPKIMENRKPMELRNVLIYYNLFQVLFSLWLFFEVSFNNASISLLVPSSFDACYDFGAGLLSSRPASRFCYSSYCLYLRIGLQLLTAYCSRTSHLSESMGVRTSSVVRRLKN